MRPKQDQGKIMITQIMTRQKHDKARAWSDKIMIRQQHDKAKARRSRQWQETNDMRLLFVHLWLQNQSYYVVGMMCSIYRPTFPEFNPKYYMVIWLLWLFQLRLPSDNAQNAAWWENQRRSLIIKIHNTNSTKRSNSSPLSLLQKLGPRTEPAAFHLYLMQKAFQVVYNPCGKKYTR